jgi:hypothetical protein
MARGSGKTSLFWTIYNAGKFRGTPTLQRTRNDLDAHGTFLDLPRLESENDVSYWKRLSSVLPLRAGSNQEGLVHGVTRELGLEEKIGIKIVPVYLGTNWLAPAPYVEVTATSLILYSAYYGSDSTSNVIDTQINIFDHGDGYLLEDVVNQIQQSENFVAELGPLVTGAERANGLVPSSSIEYVLDESVPSSTYFLLRNSDVVPGTVNFSEKDVFQTEVSPAIAANRSGGLSLAFNINSPVSAVGEYHIEYGSGAVSTILSPIGNGVVRYGYRDFPWQARWSPIVVYSLRDTDYRDKLFEDEVGVDNWTRDGLVTAEGSEVYAQIFRKSPSLWGK